MRWQTQKKLERWRNRLLRRRPVCTYCRDRHVINYFGGGTYAELHSCPVCRDGRKVADTMIPTVSAVP